MTVLQLVERRSQHEYVLDLVEIDEIDEIARVSARGAPSLATDLHPMSADSGELLRLASIAPSVGLRARRVELSDRSGRPTTDAGHEIEATVTASVRDGRSHEADLALASTSELYVERILLEDPETRAVISCTRRGVVSLQGPAAEQVDSFVRSLLAGFRRVFGAQA